MVRSGKFINCEICSKSVYIQKYRFQTFKFCSPNCRGKYGSSLTIKGRFVKGGIGFIGKHTEETKLKVSLSRRGKVLGASNPSWKGGVTLINHTIRNSAQYNEWRKTIFKRDNWSCVLCGDRQKSGHKVILQADHIKPFSLFPELRFSLDNGRTLCIDCHRKTDTYGFNIIKNNINVKRDKVWA